MDDGLSFTAKGEVVSVTPSKKDPSKSYVEVAYKGGSTGIPMLAADANLLREGQEVEITGPMKIRENRYGVTVILDGQEVSTPTSTRPRTSSASSA